jgi:diamine N-acetyltransferase
MAFLESENLGLRAMEPEDLDILYRWENDSELWKYGSSLMPYSKFALHEYLANSLHDIVHSRQLRLMAVDKINRTPIGTIDLYDYDPINQRAGIGILLDAAYRNKGLGKEMLGMMKEYAFRFLHLKQLFAYIPQSNTVSFRLFTQCDYQQAGLLKEWLKTDSGFEDVFLMQLVLL